MRAVFLKALLFYAILIVLLFMTQVYDTGMSLPLQAVFIDLLLWSYVFVTFLCLSFISERVMKYTVSYRATIFTAVLTAAMCAWYIVKFPRGENSIKPDLFGMCMLFIIFSILNSVNKFRKANK